MIVRRESTIIDYHAPFDQGFIQVFLVHYQNVLWLIRLHLIRTLTVLFAAKSCSVVTRNYKFYKVNVHMYCNNTKLLVF